MEPIKCKLAELTLNLDMSGRITPCNYNSLYLKDSTGKPIVLNTGTMKQAWHSQHRQKFLSTLDKGIPNPYCANCWNNEKNGNESMRQKFNRLLADVESLPDQPRILILKHGNKCNCSCRSCNPYSSTQWYKDAYALEQSAVPYKTWLQKFASYETSYVDNDQLHQTIAEWNQGIIFFDLYGGEPLLHPLTYKILDAGIPTQDVQLHTNGTIYKPDLAQKMSKFKSGTLGYSIDGVAEHNDYIRSGSNWSVVLENLQRYTQDFAQYDNTKINIQYCTMSHNVYYIPEAFEFFSDLGYCMGFTNRVTDKADANICYLPAHIKQAVKEKLLAYKPSHHVQSWIDQRDCTLRFLANEPSDWAGKQDSFTTTVSKLDQLRGENFAQVMPEYAALFGLGGEIRTPDPLVPNQMR